MLVNNDTQKAIKVFGSGNALITDAASIPRPRGDEILVKVAKVALNPADVKGLDLSPCPGATLGTDFCGVVCEVGKDVKKDLTVGDRVSGTTFGNSSASPENGAFAEYVVVPGDLVLKLPQNMSFAVGATISLGLATAGMSLYHVLKLPLPGSAPASQDYVLIHGAGTATGTMAIQLARESGLLPIATCSPHNFEHVKSLGAVEAFDYHSPSCGSDIQAYTGNKLAYALDCITDSATMKLCYAAIGTEGGKYVGLDPIPVRAHTRRSVKPHWIIAYTMLNTPVNWARPYKRDPRPKDREFGEQWMMIAQGLLDRGAIVPHRLQEREGGLRGVLEGLGEVRTGQAANTKLVYSVA